MRSHSISLMPSLKSTLTEDARLKPLLAARRGGLSLVVQTIHFVQAVSTSPARTIAFSFFLEEHHGEARPDAETEVEGHPGRLLAPDLPRHSRVQAEVAVGAARGQGEGETRA